MTGGQILAAALVAGAGVAVLWLLGALRAATGRGGDGRPDVIRHRGFIEMPPPVSRVERPPPTAPPPPTPPPPPTSERGGGGRSP